MENGKMERWRMEKLVFKSFNLSIFQCFNLLVFQSLYHGTSRKTASARAYKEMINAKSIC